jgi:hypothetical protein
VISFCGCSNQEIGRTFLFKGHKIGTCSYCGADSVTKKPTGDLASQGVWLADVCPFFSGCPNQIERTFLFKRHKIGRRSFLGADSVTKKSIGYLASQGGWLAYVCPFFRSIYRSMAPFAFFACAKYAVYICGHMACDCFNGCPHQEIGWPFPIQRSHNRNMFLLWHGFRHLK